MSGRPKIAIVEDDGLFVALLVAALEEEFDIVVGRDGLQGIALCLEGGVAAVITDIGMPDMNGIDMLKEFDANPRLAGIPVLVVTATHFTRLCRDEVARFPQVKRMLSKTMDVQKLAGEIKAVLRETGALA